MILLYKYFTTVYHHVIVIMILELVRYIWGGIQISCCWLFKLFLQFSVKFDLLDTISVHCNNLLLWLACLWVLHIGSNLFGIHEVPGFLFLIKSHIEVLFAYVACSLKAMLGNMKLLKVYIYLHLCCYMAPFHQCFFGFSYLVIHLY